MSLMVKICGLREQMAVEQAVNAGARYLGFIFYPPSVRALRPDEAATLMADIPDNVGKVGVFVDPSDREIETVLALCPLDVIQLHGRETPDRVAQVALRSGLQVMKAIQVETADDLGALSAHVAAADMILFDAKAPRDGAAVPGGNGLAFDWQLLQNLTIDKPWFLAGGLNKENLALAVELVDPPGVDVSSGVERWPGAKDPAKLDAFLAEARRLADLHKAS
ncbi:phosphoribosylanthranilate isomerase [Arboricoccus pini]|uniref:N-(5'-phosphoribosyl)anthranilate isomerase n=1 Tax=Arboricoccus pini TaxID=1963835 RepID=A0A212R6Y5_9PROT|nr:phosphoribosylanthranilate isomerase [Arboricoccus pini]SNB67917.1 phosphoribosylanthranilate isomerase [Arboricoccus pini]